MRPSPDRRCVSRKTLVAIVVVAVTTPACFHGTDVSKLVCDDSKYCPKGYTCAIPQGRTQGTCERLWDSGADMTAPTEAGGHIEVGQLVDAVIDSTSIDHALGRDADLGGIAPDSAAALDASLPDLGRDSSAFLFDTAYDGVPDASVDVFGSQDLGLDAPRDLPGDEPTSDLAFETGRDSPSDPAPSADVPGCIVNGTFIAEGQKVSCVLTGSLGTCANGVKTCASGQLGPCSIQPTVNDTCTIGNDDNCNGTPNDTACKVVQISAGGSHTCALLSDGMVRCWGDNGSGQIGNGSTTFSPKPSLVDGLSDVASIVAGLVNTCAISSEGAVSCWGANGDGQLGVDPAALLYSTKPRIISSTTTAPAASVTVGSAHICYLVTTDKTVRCWGQSRYGRLGNGTTTAGIVTIPTAIADLSGVASLSAGDAHTCASLSDLSVRCWGQGAQGQLGDGGSSPSALPVVVKDHGYAMSMVVSVSSGSAGNHACALGNSGGALCWGRDTNGQLGQGSTADFSPNPLSVLTADLTGDFGGMVALSAGGNHTCALLSDDTGVCWGANSSGQLGNSSTSDAYTPVPIAGLSQITAISAGAAHTCALTSTGTARCWGENRSSQIGDATTTPRSAPVAVKNLLP